MNYRERLERVIPGGAHTYSRGADQFPSNAPQILASGKGAYVFDSDRRKYLDYGMGLRAVACGYANDEIDSAAVHEIWNGNCLTRPSLIELGAAELFVDLIGCDMVKFCKNGSTAVTAAVKLARAYTGLDLVIRCAQHPFFSYDDWFIGSTSKPHGVPESIQDQTLLFDYNDVFKLESVLSAVACVVMEPATTHSPDPGYLEKVRALCDRHGVVLIFDEMITGFRWDIRGAQHFYGVKPDLSTFGKAMANGYSVACVAGRREIMELGDRKHDVFLASSTHGAEMCGLGAFVATVDFMRTHDVIRHLWSYGEKLIKTIRRAAVTHGLDHHFDVGGIPCSPWYAAKDGDGKNSLAFRTLFQQEMCRHGVLMPWIALSYAHGPAEFAKTEAALDASFTVYRKALEDGVDRYLAGPQVVPVFA
jgi:glutamate-1-semialdehyde 2,1-aminomutase